MMTIEELPCGNAPQPLPLPHFPTRWQAVIWRNWGLVPVGRLADVLHTDPETVLRSAAGMGLDPAPDVSPAWLTRGYLSLIRHNWDILPYRQLLRLLDWTPDRMAQVLKEEDFFWNKLGQHKPACSEISYAPLSPDEQIATDKLKALTNRYFPIPEMRRTEPAFAFLDQFAPPAKKCTGKPKFDFNFIHAYSAGCGDVLTPSGTGDIVPEPLLAQYAAMGIKGIWIHAQLHLLCPIPGAEEFSAGHEARFAELKRLAGSCRKQGLKLYLYLNEPRSMPPEFYRRKPLWAGYELPRLNTRTICTTRSPEPLAWLKEAMRTLFAEVPALGGVFCITMSENPTNCHFQRQHENCPSCAKAEPARIIADVITAMEQGMHAASPDAEMIAYDWGWGTPQDTFESNLAFKREIIQRLPSSVIIQSVSEWGKRVTLGGVEHRLVDYSISQVGPSEESLAVWQAARQTGKRVAAKVQINNSWELASVPYLPVPFLVEEHLENLRKSGVSGLMLSWTLGGYPGGNLELLNAAPEETAESKFHPALAAQVCAAWRAFSDAFRKFPFHVAVLYLGPMNFGPANLLYREPTGRCATMIGFPYDDLKGWREIYPEETFENQFRLLSEGWLKGLEILRRAEPGVLPEEKAAFDDLFCVAEAAYCHFNSSFQQIRFVRARDAGKGGAELASIAEAELQNALHLHALSKRDSRLGFEASNHYFYTLNDLREKVLSCALLLEDERGTAPQRSQGERV